MSAAFTPGPWEAAGQFVRTARRIEDMRGLGIAECLPENPNRVADARLIAAAPDLLAVAEFFLRGIEGGHIKCAAYIDFDPNAAQLEMKSPADRLRAAIAKAVQS